LAGGSGYYEVLVGSVWEGQPGIVYGGFTTSLILRAAGMECPAGRPASLTCQFLRPLLIREPVQVEVNPVRRGRASDLLHVELRQADKLAVDAHVRTTTATGGPTHSARPPFELGEPNACRPARDVQAEDGWERFPEFMDYIDIRSDYDTAVADCVNWHRLADGLTYEDAYLEAARIALFLDEQAPAILNRLGYFMGPRRTQMPWGFSSLDLLVHFHKACGTDWLCYVSDIIDGADGVATGRTRAWSAAGELLATAHGQVVFFASNGERRYG
jgi:acyl-CoA thioesterase